MMKPLWWTKTDAIKSLSHFSLFTISHSESGTGVTLDSETVLTACGRLGLETRDNDDVTPPSILLPVLLGTWKKYSIKPAANRKWALKIPKTKNNDNFEFLRAGVRTPINTDPDRSRTCITHNMETVSKPSCKGFRLYLNKVHKAAVSLAKNDAFVLLSLVEALAPLFISPPPLPLPLPPPPPPPPPTPSTPTPPILLSLEANICAELLIS
uniref:Uncharacterized protein n=1 Tax=Glossina morsitans morsitans TaxID=37546 RepID=A0A1B0G810_GLOMM